MPQSFNSRATQWRNTGSFFSAFLLLGCVVFPIYGQAGQTQSEKKSPPAKKASPPIRPSSETKASQNTHKKKTATKTKRSRRSQRRVVRGQRSIESSRVVEIQNALAAAGYYKAEPTGEWDELTSKAMSAYQQDNGFKTTGKPDALSLKKLGL